MNDALNQSITLRPYRVFHCDQENRKMDRTGVWKDHNGDYHCGSCGCVVRDVTMTETAKQLKVWWWGIFSHG